MKKDCYTAWQLYEWGGCLDRAREFARSLGYDGVYIILDEAIKCCEYKAKDLNPCKKTMAWLKPHEQKALDIVCDWYESTENPAYMLTKLRLTNCCVQKAQGEWVIYQRVQRP